MDMRLRLYFEELGQLVMPFPPVDEQERIVSHLQSEARKFDALSDDASRAIELLQERRAALISAAITGKIDVRNWQDHRKPEQELEPA
jgi:type I restriction enzyme S subunit